LKSQIQNLTLNIHLYLLKGDGLRHATRLLTATLHLVTLIQNPSTEKENTTIRKDMSVRISMDLSQVNEISIHLPVNPSHNFLPLTKKDGLKRGNSLI
jgi:hypothetical protein